jgi:phosphohistidine phosphatase
LINLYIMRHGEADPVGGDVKRDADRVLSEHGRNEARLMGQALAQLEPGLQQILTSPLARALETARIVAGAYPSAPPVEQTEALAPGFRRSALLTQLATYGNDAQILLVGHQPDLGRLLSWLIAEAPQAGIALGTASLAALTMRTAALDGEPTLRALLSPMLLRALDILREKD